MSISNIPIFILSGGFGTRLGKTLNDKIPKPMANINGKPFLERKIITIREYFPSNPIYLLTHHLSESIEKYFKSHKNIYCIKEDKPLGTGGSIKNAINILNLTANDKLLVFNGDTYLKPNLKQLINTSYNGISIVACYENNTLRFNMLEIKDNKVIKFLDKDSSASSNYINGGCYYFDNLIYLKSQKPTVFSIEEKLIELVINHPIGALIYDDIFIDIGVPEGYTKIQKLNFNE